MVTSKPLSSDLPIPPGEYLEEVINELGMSKSELAQRLNRPAPKFSAIFKGQKVITPDTALQLEKVVGVPAHIWTGLEAEYRLALAQKQQDQEQQRLKEECRLVTDFCYADLARLGVLAKKSRPVDKVLELQKFFGVTSLQAVLSLNRYQAAFRSGSSGNRMRSPGAVAAWLRIGELEAQKQQCAPFDKEKLINACDTIRAMTLEKIERFQDNLLKALNNCGVAFVLCHHLPRTYAQGATFWLGRQKAVVMMSLRYKWADIFWFSLFHELGHIIQQNRQVVSLEGNVGSQSSNEQENTANQFAAHTLIPSVSYEAFVKRQQFYSMNIKEFASQLNIHPGIIVGRLQNDKYLDRSWGNKLRISFEWR